MLATVGVSLYRRRYAVSTGDTISMQHTVQETRGCYEELDDVSRALRKHLENFHHLLGGYDPDEAQRWANEGHLWRRQWQGLGRRCRFGKKGVQSRLYKEFEEMTAAYQELGHTQLSYTQALHRFGRDQAPRLDRIRKRLDRIGQRLARLDHQPDKTTP
jgi:hypothetical protein